MSVFNPNWPEPAPLRLLGNIVDAAIVICGAIIVVVMFANVLARSVLDADIAWNTEFGEFVLIWATFLGSAAAARRMAHMRITELIGALPVAAVRPLEVAIRLLVLVLLWMAVWSGTAIAIGNWEQQMSVLYWPVGLGYLSMPVGLALTAIFVAHETYLIARGLVDDRTQPGIRAE